MKKNTPQHHQHFISEPTTHVAADFKRNNATKMRVFIYNTIKEERGSVKENSCKRIEYFWGGQRSAHANARKMFFHAVGILSSLILQLMHLQKCCIYSL